MSLQLYHDLLANVRHDGDFHSIKSLVQPDDAEVVDIARVLHQAADFVVACQDFVNSFTTYELEIGDYWATPSETLRNRYGDCDDKAILLVSLLRNYVAPEKVYCAFGHWSKNGAKEGHMWVVMEGPGVEDRILEATAVSRALVKGNYYLQAIFNDTYALATPAALIDFALVPVKNKEEVSDEQKAPIKASRRIY